ncbi:MAG: UDP-N-acetylmuramate--L-alanine ligase [Holosporales bacterium]
MRLPFNTLKTVHFIGIGGIGMSGIAEILANLNYPVQGSDQSINYNTARLQKMGISVFIGHAAHNIKNADVIVISSAIQDDNPELQAAYALGIPVIKRAEMLAEIMRFRFSIAVAGTHGKTTTTSMNAALLDRAGFDPTVVNGGILNSYNTNAKLGKGEWIVVESDESDGSFTKLPSTIGIITNIDPEHMEHYGSFDNLKNAFLKFIDNLPFYGLAILCIDHPVVLEISHHLKNKRFITYGFSEHAEVRATNIRPSANGTTFDVNICLKKETTPLNTKESIVFLPRSYKDLFLPMVGAHNVQNFLSCIAVALELNIEEDIIREALQSFKGVKRRFTSVGESKGIRIIDDYAHHPVEIETVLKAAKQCEPNKIIAVVQPHRFSRVKDLMEEFSRCTKLADFVILTPIYSAGESPIDGIDSKTLAEMMRKNGQTVFEIEESKELPFIIARIAQKGDYVVCMGAGSITLWAASLPLELEQITPDSPFDLEKAV